jgi:hypothetical protein
MTRSLSNIFSIDIEYFHFSKESKFDICDNNSITDEILLWINSLVLIFQLPSSSIRLLLLHFNWNIEQLKATYENSTQWNKANLGWGNVLKVSDSIQVKENTYKCPICLEEINLSQCLNESLSCGHSVCITCWYQYIDSVSQSGAPNGKSCIYATCPYSS